MDNNGGIWDSNNIHSTYVNINTTLGAHFNSKTSHIIHIIISTFITINLREQKLLPLLKITYYIGVQVDLRIIVKRIWNNHIPV